MLYLPLSLRLRGGGGTRDGKRRAPSSGTGSAKKKHKAAAAGAPLPLRVEDDSDEDGEYVPSDGEGDDSGVDDLEPDDDDTGDDGTQVGEDSEEDEDNVEEDNPVAGDAGAGAAAGPDAAAAGAAAQVRMPAAALLAELKAAKKQNRRLERTVAALAAAQHPLVGAARPQGHPLDDAHHQQRRGGVGVPALRKASVRLGGHVRPRCDAKVALHPSPSPTSPRPASTADSPDVFTTQALRAAGVAGGGA